MQCSGCRPPGVAGTAQPPLQTSCVCVERGVKCLHHQVVVVAAARGAGIPAQH
jgi:hypothetical protein